MRAISSSRRPASGSMASCAGPRPIFVDHFKFLKCVAHATPKQTIPSPSTMHFRGGRGAIDKKAYPDLAEFYADLGRVYSEEVRDLAAAGCRYLQIDEVNFAYLCDPKLREQVRNIGEDPATLPHTYAKLINASIATKPKDMVVSHASLPRQFQERLGRRRRLRAGGRDPLQRNRCRRLFPRIRRRALGRFRAAALPAEGQDRRAWPGHDQAAAAREQGRVEAPHRRGRANMRPWTSWR